MKLNPFSRKPKAQPQPVTGNLYTSATTVMPIPATAVIPVAPTIKMHSPEDMQYCAACGEIGAKIPLPQRVSIFGYINLPYARLCPACIHTFTVNQCNQHFKQRKEPPNTELRIKAINLKEQQYTGGIVQHTGMTIVGEPGPETLIFPKDATIVPTSTTPHVSLHVKTDDHEIEPTMILPVAKKEPA